MFVKASKNLNYLIVISTSRGDKIHSRMYRIDIQECIVLNAQNETANATWMLKVLSEA